MAHCSRYKNYCVFWESPLLAARLKLSSLLRLERADKQAMPNVAIISSVAWSFSSFFSPRRNLKCRSGMHVHATKTGVCEDAGCATVTSGECSWNSYNARVSILLGSRAMKCDSCLEKLLMRSIPTSFQSASKLRKKTDREETLLWDERTRKMHCGGRVCFVGVHTPVQTGCLPRGLQASTSGTALHCTSKQKAQKTNIGGWFISAHVPWQSSLICFFF